LRLPPAANSENEVTLWRSDPLAAGGDTALTPPKFSRWFHTSHPYGTGRHHGVPYQFSNWPHTPDPPAGIDPASFVHPVLNVGPDAGGAAPGGPATFDPHSCPAESWNSRPQPPPDEPAAHPVPLNPHPGS